MDMQNCQINLFALTDCHQEARRQCCLFSEILARVAPQDSHTLICDGGDLFKGIYDRQLCVDNYLKLRQALPHIQIVLGLGNNDFGFNTENFNYLKDTIKTFSAANIHVLCANLIDLQTQKHPDWIKPYVCLTINHKKIMITAFCINHIRLQRYGFQLTDILPAFQSLKEAIQTIKPDTLIILNHALMPSSRQLIDAAQKMNIHVDLIIGGHEHQSVQPDFQNHIYYPQAYNKDLLHLQLNYEQSARTDIKFIERIECSACHPDPEMLKPIEKFEQAAGLNIPIAPSILDLEKRYSDPCSIGTFITDHMRRAAHTDIALLSTGYICLPLRYKADKILTKRDVERAFSANTPCQILQATASNLLDIFNNAVRNRYNQNISNARFLQCSNNIKIVCRKEAHIGQISQIYINDHPLLNEQGKILNETQLFSCAVDPFIGAGELGFDAFAPLKKETFTQKGVPVTIKEIFINALKTAEKEYAKGSTYPHFQLIDD